MNFSDYLFYTKRLTHAEYVHLVIKQNLNAFHGYRDDANGFYRNDLSAVRKLEEVRRVPFGDHLIHDSEVMARLKAIDPKFHIESLLEEWREWHVKNMEPICDYSLSTKIGKEIFNHQEEKKLVANYVSEKLVNDNDIVCIPEGSSATYVGMGVGLRREKVTVVTSNDPLVREYRENPQLSRRFRGMEAVGGHVDDFIAHGGVSGPKCQEQFEKAIATEPGATVVIMPVTGLLPQEGPYGLDSSTCKLKEHLIKASLQGNVRALVFITVYTKHLPSKKNTYGSPVFNRTGEWKDLLKVHRDRIWIVTAPPPELRKQMNAGRIEQPLVRQVRGSYTLPDAEREYDDVAKEFARYTRQGNSFQTRFIEVVHDTASLKKPEDETLKGIFPPQVGTDSGLVQV